MSICLIVSVAPGETRAARVEADRIVALGLDRDGQGSVLGACFLGRVARVVPSLPGAFIDLGLDRPAFLPGSHPLVEGAAQLVQVVKDAFEDKPPEVTATLRQEGALAVWTPAQPGRSISRRIAAPERQRLLAALDTLVTPDDGIMLRTAAAEADETALAAEIAALRARHEAILAAAGRVTAPARLDRAPGAVELLIGSLGVGAERILLDDRAAYAETRSVFARERPDLAARLELDIAPGFGRRHGLDEAFDTALASHVRLPGGGHLTIESGVAFTQIDVDLGAAAEGRSSAGDAIRQVNVAAAEVIARHLRLRNIGGAVVVDFIGMRGPVDRRAVETTLEAAVASDPVGVTLHGWTRLGHFELTRRRTTPSLADLMLGPAGQRRELTPTSVALAALRTLVNAPFQPGAVTLHLHPSVVAVLDTTLADALARAAQSAGRAVRLAGDPARDVETFDIARG